MSNDYVCHTAAMARVVQAEVTTLISMRTVYSNVLYYAIGIDHSLIILQDFLSN
jgi:hypothetical protein